MPSDNSSWFNWFGRICRCMCRKDLRRNDFFLFSTLTVYDIEERCTTDELPRAVPGRLEKALGTPGKEEGLRRSCQRLSQKTGCIEGFESKGLGKESYVINVALIIPPADEFYYAMINSKTVKGVHSSTKSRTAEYDHDELKLLRTQDIGYINHMQSVNAKVPRSPIPLISRKSKS
jgi:hypothetical protein